MNTLIKPMITEKSIVLASQGIYTFMVDVAANKHQIKEAVSGLFGVTVENVSTLRVHTPAARTGRRRIMRSGTPKKIARVTVKKGQTIELFDLKQEN